MRVVMLAYLSLGSNLGDRRANMEQAITRLEQHGHVVLRSSFYETEPVEFTQQPWFLNCVIALETEETPDVLLSGLLEIERELGRVRDPGQKKGPRTIDLDILLFGDLVTHSESLTLPHPEMHQRRFVLQPLVEIAPHAFHPLLKLTAEEMLRLVSTHPIVRKA
jgi:2-amino-4-hydroxy-6-hydroxymethyldihydropteridine diphosphokinase